MDREKRIQLILESVSWHPQFSYRTEQEIRNMSDEELNGEPYKNALWIVRDMRKRREQTRKKVSALLIKRLRITA